MACKKLKIIDVTLLVFIPQIKNPIPPMKLYNTMNQNPFPNIENLGIAIKNSQLANIVENKVIIGRQIFILLELFFIIAFFGKQ